MISFRKLCSKVSKQYAKGKLSSTEKLFKKKYLDPMGYIQASCNICLLKNKCEETPDKLSHICYTSFQTNLENIWIHNYKADVRDVNGKVHHYRIDIYFPNLTKGIEADGEVWHNLWGVKEKDKYRDNLIFEKLSIPVYRFSSKLIRRGIKTKLKRILKE